MSNRKEKRRLFNSNCCSLSRFTRSFRIHAMQQWRRCQWCNVILDELTATADHILARSRGGKDYWSNFALSCAPCNGEKGNQHKDCWPIGPRWGSEKEERKRLRVDGPLNWFIQNWFLWIKTDAWERLTSKIGNSSSAKQANKKARLIAESNTQPGVIAYIGLPECLTPDSWESRLFTVWAAAGVGLSDSNILSLFSGNPLGVQEIAALARARFGESYTSKCVQEVVWRLVFSKKLVYVDKKKIALR